MFSLSVKNEHPNSLCSANPDPNPDKDKIPFIVKKFPCVGGKIPVFSLSVKNEHPNSLCSANPDFELY